MLSKGITLGRLGHKLHHALMIMMVMVWLNSHHVTRSGYIFARFSCLSSHAAAVIILAYSGYILVRVQLSLTSILIVVVGLACILLVILVQVDVLLIRRRCSLNVFVFVALARWKL